MILQRELIVDSFAGGGGASSGASSGAVRNTAGEPAFLRIGPHLVDIRSYRERTCTECGLLWSCECLGGPRPLVSPAGQFEIDLPVGGGR